MFLEGILFDKVIYINLFDVFIMFFMLDEGKRIYKFIVEEGLNLDIWVGIVFVIMCVRCGDVDSVK